MFPLLLAITTLCVAALAGDLPPSCDRPVYCDSELLHHVQMARIFPDSKTFVDLSMKEDEDTTLDAFEKLLQETNRQPSVEQIKEFVDEYFSSTGELDDWTPPDYSENPAFLNGVVDGDLRQFGKDINSIWPTLGRKVRNEVLEKPRQFSLMPVTHGFIAPGGRFKELYYWDTYWIVEGLLISDMLETAKGVIENLLELVKAIGHVPNGSRWYYQERSQPPLLVAMVALYYEYSRKDTKDLQFLQDNIEILEDELNYWLDTQIVALDKDDKIYTLLRYYAPSQGPRPESYYEDYTNAQYFNSEDEKSDFYTEIKSGAESGWDFSTRWFRNNDGNLTTIKTTKIIPVDLNAIFANALHEVAYFHAELKNPHKAATWETRAKQWRSNIEKVHWNEDDGIWYDYDMENKMHRKDFHPSNLSPLWIKAISEDLVAKHAPRVVQYVERVQGTNFPGGVPASLIKSGEQWDFPNAWPPLVSMVIVALQNSGTQEGSDRAFEIAQTWVRACHKGYVEEKAMFEKYDVEEPGKVGGGGEYNVQLGFGWTNGVVLELLQRYGERLTAYDSTSNPEVNVTK